MTGNSTRPLESDCMPKDKASKKGNTTTKVQLFQDANMISLFQDEGLANWTKIRPGKVVHSKVKT